MSKISIILIHLSIRPGLETEVLKPRSGPVCPSLCRDPETEVEARLFVYLSFTSVSTQQLSFVNIRVFFFRPFSAGLLCRQVYSFIPGTDDSDFFKYT